MKITRGIFSASLLALASTCACADTLNGNGSWQSWSPTVLNTVSTVSPGVPPSSGPYWNGASGDGANYNVGWCLTGTGNCHISNPPGALAYYGNGSAAASTMSFTSSGIAQEVSLLGLFSNQNGVPLSGSDYFGWYSIGSSATIGPLNPLLSSASAIGATATFMPTTNYGFYFENVQSAGASYTASYFWLTDDGQNYATGTGIADAGTQHFSIFGASGSSTYYLGMEDTPAPTSDFDYNDMIVELQPVSVPEPASITLLVGGISLLGLVIRRGI